MAERHAYRAQRLETLHKIIESFIAGTDTSFQFNFNKSVLTTVTDKGRQIC
jgi:hypothetical protein